MSVYLFMEARIKDHDRYRDYLEYLTEIITRFDGRWLACDSAVMPLSIGMKEERRQPQRVSLIEFPSMVHLRRCFASPEHQRIRDTAVECAETRAIVIQGGFL
jgi:uncharacterized protein (DUF1330 family)